LFKKIVTNPALGNPAMILGLMMIISTMAAG
jgi:hypothetical protein